MKIRFTTLGCKLNFAESSAIGKELILRGHTKAKKDEPADLCVINTCTVTDNADQKDRQAIHRIRRENPNAILIVTGCYAQLKHTEILKFPEVDYVLNQDDKFRIPELVETLEHIQEHPFEETPTTFFPAYSKDDRTRCFLKVQDGCNYFCTYCTIPMARGRSRNGSIETIVQQAQSAIQQGAKEIVLTGVNIGDFGRSTNETFIDLLKALDAIDGTFRYRISSCEPNLLSDEVIDFVANSHHFAPHFHIPLQSGSDNVLKIMHRHYDTALFKERIEHIKKVMPNAFIGVDCMVGVRGETQEDFDTYLTFIKNLPVSQLHVFTYSERANTRMLQLDLYIVPAQERKKRSDIMHAISAEKLANFYKQHKGDKAIVLWEAKREGNLMFGFTENYIRVSCPYNKDKINTFEEICI